MKRRLRLVGAGTLLLLGALALLAVTVVPPLAEARLNPVLAAPPYEVSEAARAVHRRLLVADLHADPLLWSRDLLARGTRGAVDVPRLAEGNVALQVFGLVTKTPRGMNYEGNDDSTDNILLVSLLQRWPRATWTSLTARALHQAAKLHDVAARSQGRFTVVHSREELAAFLARRAADPSLVAGLLAVEGAHALEGDVARVDALYDAGVRMISVAHFFDNEIGGSAHGVTKGGLTERGRELVRRMEQKRLVLDLSHASPRSFDEAIALSTRPVVVSHTGVRATCAGTRNLSDEQIRAVTGTGGLVGIGYWDSATCGTDAAAIARAIRHVRDLVGIRHVALGSDYDGAVKVPFDTTGIPLITQELLAAGFSEEEIGLAMGGNVLRLLGELLP